MVLGRFLVGGFVLFIGILSFFYSLGWQENYVFSSVKYFISEQISFALWSLFELFFVFFNWFFSLFWPIFLVYAGYLMIFK
jgi:hypothetical protein